MADVPLANTDGGMLLLFDDLGHSCRYDPSAALLDRNRVFLDVLIHR
jgi:hypothetical protein